MRSLYAATDFNFTFPLTLLFQAFFSFAIAVHLLTPKKRFIFSFLRSFFKLLSTLLLRFIYADETLHFFIFTLLLLANLLGSSRKFEVRRCWLAAADFLREAKSARFPVRGGERIGDGDLLGEPELSDRRDPSPDPNLWRMLASLWPKSDLADEQGLEVGFGDGGIGESWGMTMNFWAWKLI